MTGYQSKKVAAQDRDAEIGRLNEKIEFLARTNMLYSDWEHRETQVTSDLIRKGIEEAKINAELRAEIAELKAQLVAQPAQEPVAWKETDEVECPVCKDKGFPWPKCGHITYLESTPPQRPWVGLTDEETETLIHRFDGDPHTLLDEVNARLKEKNNAA